MTIPAPTCSPNGFHIGSEASAGVGISRQGLDACKGILIAFIVLGHNALITQNVRAVFLVLFCFHVTAFLLLPFLLPVRPFSAAFVRDRAIRYLVPHAWFFLAASASYLVMFLHCHPTAPWFGSVLFGAVAGNARITKFACGFQLFWFLPTLLALVAFLSFYASASRRLRVACVLGAILAHGTVVWLPEPVKHFMPWGLGIVLYVFPLGIMTRYLWHSVCRNIPGLSLVTCSLLCLLCSLYSIATRQTVLLGWLQVPSFFEPVRLITMNVFAISATLLLILLGERLARVPGLVTMGRHSISIYLIHSFCFQLALIALLGPVKAGACSPALQVAIGLLLALTTIFVCIGISHLLHRHDSLRRAIYPRDWADLTSRCHQ